MENNLVIKKCKCGNCVKTYYILTEDVIEDLKNKCTICKTELKYDTKI